MADTTLYLFDGYNLLHAGSFTDARELVDQLASFVALRGARGVVVFDGVGEERTHGPLEVRFAPHADAVLERLAAEFRGRERVCLVSSDFAVRGTIGAGGDEGDLGDVRQGVGAGRQTGKSALIAWASDSIARQGTGWSV